MHAKLLQSCPTLCDPTDCSPSGSSVHEILQARILKLWCPLPGDRLSPGTEPAFLRSPALAGRFFTTSTTWEAPKEQVVECLVWDIILNFKNLKFTNQYCVCMWWLKTKNIKMWSGKIYSSSKWLRPKEGAESQMQEVYKRSSQCICYFSVGLTYSKINGRGFMNC